MTAPADTAVRIAMWSGPRNISTAMMRSFGARTDCHVVDEPFYALYLERTGIVHPMREEILASQKTDPDAVIADLMGPLPAGKTVFYQKHMTHHMLPGIDLAWTQRVQNAFLIRRPEDVLASYVQKREEVSLEEIGFRQQAEIFDRVADRLGKAPPVIEGNDVLKDPAKTLALLCTGVGIPFDPAMLSWEPGRRDTDGIWAPHWYHAVEASTGFGPPREGIDASALPDHLRAIADAARPYYETLAAHALRPQD
ncbi:hypothetical protein HDIA_3534 [Hartmannibacter diazotrophicus]|uniref:Branched-chain amino acid aminotransferase n=1 Tax=Hartmannibacter diazotrophicus TaxID=1482074 RepID=A0A2C9DBU2_9HYPH|nr:sulfotransferase family protein [Hartmannibacter diazotrophicus]SON57075.1 hypothetical protein HDIA_3534 [Hartmannibacter diazotrophicus]